MNNFAVNFKRLRESMNYTQDYVAYQLCVPPHVIQSWENGESMPDSNVLPQIANLFCCSIDLLFQNPDETDMGKSAYTLFSKGPLTRRKARDVMYKQCISGIAGGIFGIVFGIILSIILTLHPNSIAKYYLPFSVLFIVVGICGLIYSSKRLYDIKHDKLDIPTKRRKNKNGKDQ